ncbi:hypothetical protein Q7C36_023188 [Tachysurus vachellii]|uniref:Uncharacterized protein n=1 Tax=Tachysurus vachellii TaxID=175792 RepID=A0AA88IZY6_TACVA|nr:hypothetical protein Q7C36_023188 [Tachysurus vachellii]
MCYYNMAEEKKCQRGGQAKWVLTEMLKSFSDGVKDLAQHQDKESTGHVGALGGQQGAGSVSTAAVLHCDLSGRVVIRSSVRKAETKPTALPATPAINCE